MFLERSLKLRVLVSVSKIEKTLKNDVAFIVFLGFSGKSVWNAFGTRFWNKTMEISVVFTNAR